MQHFTSQVKIVVPRNLYCLETKIFLYAMQDQDLNSHWLLNVDFNEMSHLKKQFSSLLLTNATIRTS